MSKSVVEITGFKEFQAKIKSLPDKVKKKELVKLLGQVANPTLKAMRSFTPVSSGSNKGFARIKRQVGKTIITENYTPGYGRKTIAKATMKRSKNAMIVVGPRTRKGKDGYYLRQWVIPGTRFFKGNDFAQKAMDATKGLVTKDAEMKVTKYIQKTINRL